MLSLKELEKLITYWKGKQGNGLGFDDTEYLLNTIIALESLRGLLKFDESGIKDKP